jgi:hypothetical protein
MYSKFSKLEAKHQTIFGIIIAIGLILLHRGIVGLMDMYVLPDIPYVSHVLSLMVALFILVSTHYAIK